MTDSPSWNVDLAARYEILEEAGRGGMGVVYKARDRETGELVALKILKPEIAADRIASERFLNEVRLSRRITHKNVCRVYEFTRTGTTAYLSMEFVEGESLRSILDRMGAVNVRKGVQIARQLCAALYEAHSQGIIHRDLKPENVMLDRSGNVKVMDFGIARLADTSVTATSGGIVGTPAYMSPEQAEGHPLDARTDIYSTGLVLYEIFTGQAAFSGDTPVAIALKHIRETPAPPRTIDPGILPDLNAIIMRCLEKDPAKRYQTIEELDAALAALPAGVTAMAGAGPAHLDRSTRGTTRGDASSTWPTVQTPNTTPLGAPSQERRLRRPSTKVLAIAAALAVVAVLAGAYFAFWRAKDPIPFTSFKLPNGLQVLLSEDHSAPVVSVVVTYNVGSRDDPPGREGLAHLFEHAMFSGSLNVGRGEHQYLVTSQGGTANGSSNIDYTMYFETLPSNQLDLALFLEADRMRSLRLDEARMNVDRATVIAEWQQRVQNQTYGRINGLLLSSAFDLRRYKHEPIGNAEAIRAATLQEIADFFKIYYAPNNAVIAVVGDFDPSDARTKIQNYFEHIPAQPPAPVGDFSESPQPAERRASFEDPFASSGRIFLAYKLPPGDTEDAEAIEVLSTILGDGGSSRLNQRLVKDLDLATGVGSGLDWRKGPSLLTVAIAPAAERDNATVLKALDDTIAALKDKGVSDEEVARARNRLRVATATQLQQSVQRGVLLTMYQVKFGGADRANTHLRRMDDVTAADVKRVAAEYLKPERRTILTVTAAAAKAAATPPASTAPIVSAQDERLGRAPISKDLVRVSLPPVKELSFDNGLTLMVATDRRVPLVAVRFQVAGAGPAYDPPDLPGLGLLGGIMLREGTPTRSSRTIAQDLDLYGASMPAAIVPDTTMIGVQAIGLSETFASWFPIVADAVINSSFAADELVQMKRRLASDWKSRNTIAANRAADAFERAIYGPAAFAGRITADSFNAISSDRLRAWHRDRFGPQQTIVSIAGAIDADDAEQVVRKTLGSWQKAGQLEQPPAAAPPPGTHVEVIERPGSVQTSAIVGVPAVDRASSDYVPLVVINRVLGGTPAARLGMKLRQERGIAYDARSSVNAYRQGGDWRALAELNATHTAEGLDAVVAEFRRLAAEPVPADEFERAQRSIVASFALTLEQLSQVVSYMASRRGYGLSADYWERYPEKIMAVTPADAQRVAAKYLDPSRFQIVAVGDSAMLTPILAKYNSRRLK